jgi:regulator of replication initiation timing
MTDIIERVRGHDWDGSGFSESLAEEAADEIERLRAIAQAHNDSLVARIEEVERLSHSIITDERNPLRAENERLREALEEIAKCDGAYDPDAMQHALNCMTNMRDTARAALQSKGEKDG